MTNSLSGEPQESTFGCLKLTWKQRLLGFVICFSLGTLMSLLAMSQLGRLLSGRPQPFILLYTLSNVTSLASTFCLMGPSRQLQGMLHPSRRVASIGYGVALVMALIALISKWPPLVLLILVLVQWFALLSLYSHVLIGLI